MDQHRRSLYGTLMSSVGKKYNVCFQALREWGSLYGNLCSSFHSAAMMDDVRGKTEFRKCYDLWYRILHTFCFRRGVFARGLLRKLLESLLRELERIRMNVHRPLKRTVNLRDGNENQRQQKRKDKYEHEM
jgi:hypothetical protein